MDIENKECRCAPVPQTVLVGHAWANAKALLLEHGQKPPEGGLTGEEDRQEEAMRILRRAQVHTVLTFELEVVQVRAGSCARARVHAHKYRKN